MTEAEPTNGATFAVLLWRLIASGIFLAVFLTIEWALLSFLEWTSGGQVHAVEVIIEIIRVSSALGVCALFIIHTVRIVLEYARWQ